MENDWKQKVEIIGNVGTDVRVLTARKTCITWKIFLFKLGALEWEQLNVAAIKQHLGPHKEANMAVPSP